MVLRKKIHFLKRKLSIKKAIGGSKKENSSLRDNSAIEDWMLGHLENFPIEASVGGSVKPFFQPQENKIGRNTNQLLYLKRTVLKASLYVSLGSNFYG